MNQWLDTDLLRTFVAAAETSNFTKAGTRVGRTQSAVSLQIKKLEEDIGGVLFDRGSRGVVLTAQGTELLTRARRVIALLDETTASMRRPFLTGAVRIGIPEEFGSLILPKILANFDKVHPAVEITVNFGQSSTNIESLSNGTLDLAVVYEPGDRTVHEVLYTDPTVWVTSRVHEPHRQSPIPVAMYTTPGWCRAAAMEQLELLGARYRIAYHSDTTSGLSAAIEAGLAIAPLSRSGIQPSCRELTLAENFAVVDHSNVVLLFNTKKTNEAIEGLADAVREAFRQSAQ